MHEKMHLARIRRCIEQFYCAATEKRKSVGAAVNYTCSGSLPPSTLRAETRNNATLVIFTGV